MATYADRLAAVVPKLQAKLGTPAPAPSPSPTPPPSTGGGLSSVRMIGDDYTRYASTADFLKACSTNIGGTGDPASSLYTDGRNATLASIDENVRYNGHHTLRYDQPGGVGSTPELWAGFPTFLPHFWFRGKIRFSPGFTTTGSLTAAQSANAYKLLAWGWAPGMGNGRGDFAITNTTEYQLEFNVQVNGTAIVESPFAVAGHIATEWTDGLWYDYILEFNRTSGTTATARAWYGKDGSVPVLKATSSATRTDGQNLPLVGSMALGMNFNQNRITAQALWYGQWEVIDGTAHPDPYGLG